MTNHRFFPETHWSNILTAGQVGSPKAEEALETLCRSHWYPLYAFARKQGYSPPEAEDLTQSFFALLLEKNFIGKARVEKGRFRSFLLASFCNFLSKARERDPAAKRGGGIMFLGGDQRSAVGSFGLKPIDNSTPETLYYERTWALTVLQRVLARTEEEYRRLGEERTFEHLRIFLQGEIASVSYAQLSERLGMTERGIKVAIHRMRKRYAKFLREEISNTPCEFFVLDDDAKPAPISRSAASFVTVKLFFVLLKKEFKGLMNYFSVSQLQRITTALSLALFFQLGLWFLTNGTWTPARSILLIDFFISVILVCLLRLLWRP
jgi:DNA-directed RNA polymerase specialized sigma24 family protein